VSRGWHLAAGARDCPPVEHGTPGRLPAAKLLGIAHDPDPRDPIVGDLELEHLRRVEEHSLPLESARDDGVRTAERDQPVAGSQRRPEPGRGVVLLLRETIGF